MPTLADIYSMIDSAKRRGTDFIRNPGTSLQQIVGNANDRARAQLESDRAATDEFLATKNLNGPLQMQNAMEFAQGYNPVGMTVYHGSPHLFERFDLGKIGTGEGNQSYGRGLYMAEARKTAEEYRKALSNPEVVLKSGERISNPQLGTGEDVAKAWLEEAYLNKDANPFNTAISKISKLRNSANNPAQFDDALNVLKKWQSEGANVDLGGALYKVDLPDTHVRRMIDWDEPLKNQPSQIRNLAKSLGMDLNDLGGDLIGKIGKGEEGKQILQKAGIRGIKYLDQGTRGTSGGQLIDVIETPTGWKSKIKVTNRGGTQFQSPSDIITTSMPFKTKEEATNWANEKIGSGTRNFVVFDPNHLTILERNNQPIK